MFAKPFLLLLLLLPLFIVIAGSSDDSRDRCEALVKRWAEQEIWAMQADGPDGEKWKLQDLLFFLHVPRTGGRNYNQCFLKNMFAAEQLCPRSYDKFRIKDPSNPNCSLLSTHDDYSIISRLPKAGTSIITNMRDPTSRVLSSYEFSVEVAARFLKRSRALLRRVPVGPRTQTMSTLDIWPWRYLVPLLQRDLFSRRDSRLTGSFTGASPKKSPNMYDVPSYVMPLKDYIEHPAVHELVHNGATFQVAGITNNSYLKEAKEIRACVAQHEELGNHVLNVAKRRLDGMLYVGLTERHRDSAQIFVHLVGRQLASRDYKVMSAPDNSTGTETDYGFSNLVNETNSYEDFINQMVTSYEKCSMSLRMSQVGRRMSSLEAIPPVNFTKQSRKLIPGDVLARILQLNNLDFELYQHAKKLFELEQEYVNSQAEDLKKLELRPTLKNEISHTEEDEDLNDSYSFIIGCSVVISALGLYFLIKSLFWRERGRVATHKLDFTHQKD